LVSRFAVPAALRERPDSGRVKIDAVREHLEAHYAENISLAELASVAGASAYHLSRLFTAEVGMPPHAFQTQARVERAKSLLLSGMSVAEAAAETGFFD